MFIVKSAVRLLALVAVLGPAALASLPPPIPVGSTFDYQLGQAAPLNPSASTTVVVVDFDNGGITPTYVQSLKNAGHRVLCYISVGTYESWRTDAAKFQTKTAKVVLGSPVNGWAGEQWLDVRRMDILLPIMIARFQRAQALGCEGIDPDNVDGYTNEPGFDFTDVDQLAYNKNISTTIRNMGLLVGLKNDNDQASQLVSYYDFAVVEQCAFDDAGSDGDGTECPAFNIFISNNKPVFAVEYIQDPDDDGWASISDFQSNVCQKYKSSKFAFILQNMNLQTKYLSAC